MTPCLLQLIAARGAAASPAASPAASLGIAALRHCGIFFPDATPACFPWEARACLEGLTRPTGPDFFPGGTSGKEMPLGKNAAMPRDSPCPAPAASRQLPGPSPSSHLLQLVTTCYNLLHPKLLAQSQLRVRSPCLSAARPVLGQLTLSSPQLTPAHPQLTPSSPSAHPQLTLSSPSQRPAPSCQPQLSPLARWALPPLSP